MPTGGAEPAVSGQHQPLIKSQVRSLQTTKNVVGKPTVENSFIITNTAAQTLNSRKYKQGAFSVKRPASKSGHSEQVLMMCQQIQAHRQYEPQLNANTNEVSLKRYQKTLKPPQPARQLVSSGTAQQTAQHSGGGTQHGEMQGYPTATEGSLEKTIAKIDIEVADPERQERNKRFY